jgi:hypothetical protein
MTHHDSDVVVPEDGRELHIGENGLWVPPELREFEGQVVFRTPRSTLQHFGSTDLDPYYGMIDESDFGEEDELTDPQNPELVPDQVSIKHQGEPAETFPVDTDPDVKV